MRDVKSAWIAWFAGFLMLAVGWALVTPVNGYPDEVDHVYRAVSVARGEVFPQSGAYNHGTGAITQVPLTLATAMGGHGCRVGSRTVLRCPSLQAPRPENVTVVTSEGRRFPLYYALVGWPSLLRPNRTGVYLMRLVNAALCAAFLATGAYVMMSMRRRPLVLAGGLLVGLTPYALYLAGSVNPSALEIASAACFWAVILALVHRTSSVAPRQLVWLGVVSGVILATCRELGPLWILLAVAFSIMTVGRAERNQFLRARSTHIVVGSGFVAALVASAWAVAFRSYQVFKTPPRSGGTGLVDAVQASAGNIGKLLEEMLGYLGWLTLRPPLAAEICWALALIALAVVAAVSSRRAAIVGLVGCALVVALPFAINVLNYHDGGLGDWQGRYTLPFAVGVPLLVVAPSRIQLRERRFVVLLIFAVAIFTIWGQIAVFEGAWPKYDNHASSWYVPVGRALLAVGAIVVLATVVWADVRWWRNRPAAHERYPAADLAELQVGEQTQLA